MNLDELKKQAKQDLPIINHEHLDQESFKNQDIVPKWLDYRAKWKLLVTRHKVSIQGYIDKNGNIMVVRLM